MPRLELSRRPVFVASPYCTAPHVSPPIAAIVEAKLPQLIHRPLEVIQEKPFALRQAGQQQTMRSRIRSRLNKPGIDPFWQGSRTPTTDGNRLARRDPA